MSTEKTVTESEVFKTIGQLEESTASMKRELNIANKMKTKLSDSSQLWVESSKEF